MRETPIYFSPSLKQDIVQLVPPDPRHLQPITANERKLSHIIITSKDEPPVDVECKSESKPLFFKPLFSRLQSNPITEIRTARKRRHMLECRNQSSLKIKESSAESMQIETKKPTRRELPTEQPNDLTASASYYHPSPLLATPEIQDYRDIVQQYYSQQYLMPAFNSILQPPDLLTFPTVEPHLTFEQKSHEILKPNSSLLNSENSRLHFSDGMNFNLGKQNIAQMSTVPHNEPSKKNKQTSHSQNFLQFKTESLLKTTTEVSTSVVVPLKKEIAEKPQQFVIEVNSDENRTSARSETPIATKIILKPLARAKAGSHGIAISSPISTAYIKRGDYVEIEYLPEATADVGEGGVAISKPELIIHFIDRRRK